MTLTKAKAKAKCNNYTRQNHKVKHNYYNRTNDFMERRDSGSHRWMSCPLHLGPYALGKRFWRALDAYRRDHGMVDEGNYSLWEYTLEYTKGKFGWLCQLW